MIAVLNLRQVAQTLSGKIYNRHFEGVIRSEQTIQALQHLQSHLPSKIILIWDRACIHTSKKVKEYIANHPEIRVELLQTYAPELNPEEYCHDSARYFL